MIHMVSSGVVWLSSSPRQGWFELDRVKLNYINFHGTSQLWHYKILGVGRDTSYVGGTYF